MSEEIWVIAKQNGIIPIIIPANCTDMLQPMDFLFFKMFKQKWSEVVEARRLVVPVENNIPNGVVCAMVKRAIDKFGEDDIKDFLIRAFEETGLYPPNPVKVQQSELFPFLQILQ